MSVTICNAWWLQNLHDTTVILFNYVKYNTKCCHEFEPDQQRKPSWLVFFILCHALVLRIIAHLCFLPSVNFVVCPYTCLYFRASLFVFSICAGVFCSQTKNIVKKKNPYTETFFKVVYIPSQLFIENSKILAEFSNSGWRCGCFPKGGLLRHLVPVAYARITASSVTKCLSCLHTWRCVKWARCNLQMAFMWCWRLSGNQIDFWPSLWLMWCSLLWED